MPNKQTHTGIGTLAGAGVAAYRAQSQEPLYVLLEAIGGAMAGYVGGRLPDVIEPATWPGHRQLAHSMGAGTGVLYGGYKLVKQWEEWCRSTAAKYRHAGEQDDLCGFEKLLCVLKELLAQLAAGIPGGFVAGYASHLVLDMGTPKGVPVLYMPSPRRLPESVRYSS